MKSPCSFKVITLVVIFVVNVCPALSKPHKREKEGKGYKPVVHSYEKPKGKYMAWSPSKDDVDSQSKVELDVLCENVECLPGLQCKYGVCVCGGSDLCAEHYHPVCGTDGILYPSHCELHRTACLLQKHIRINHDGSRCEDSSDSDDNDEDDVKKSNDYGVKKHTKKAKKHHKKSHKGKHHKLQDGRPSMKKDLSFKKEEFKPAEKKPIHQEKKQEAKEDIPPYVELKSSDVKLKRVKKIDDLAEVKENDEHKEKSKAAEVKPVVEKDVKKVVEEKPIKPEAQKAVSPQALNEIRKKKCDKAAYDDFKNKLLEFHCNRLGKEDCQKTGGNRSPFLANAMFSYFDKNYDDLLDKWELDYTQTRDHLEKLSKACVLSDLLKYDDTRQADDYVDIDEFHLAFGIPNVFLEGPRIFHVTAVSDPSQSVELKCDVNGATHVIWTRNGVDLTKVPEQDIKVSQNGMLFLSPVGLHHAGNYSCYDKTYPTVVQTHQVKVQVAPKVEVYPPSIHYSTGLDVTINCRADGIPTPKILWEVNEFPIHKDKRTQHYSTSENNASLQIRHLKQKQDTGAYKCRAINEAGEGQDISTLFVTPESDETIHRLKTKEMFIAFHADGYVVLNANQCSESYSTKGTDQVFDKKDDDSFVDTLCQPGEPCEWGSSVNVKNKFIYVSQPSLNRVIVIDLTKELKWKPIQAIETDPMPVKLQYVEHLDQVWILNWNSKSDTSSKSIQVVKGASVGMTHSVVHIRPLGNHFDAVKDVFLPPNTDIKHNFKYGYIIHGEVAGLQKIDMKTLSYVSSVDLKENDCIPTSVSFIALRGQIIVDCNSAEGKQHKLILDYITDSVVKTLDTRGRTLVTPDGRRYINIEDDKHITVYKVDDEGDFAYAFESWPNVPVDDVTFISSLHHNGYDFYASAQNANQLWYINLDDGKTDLFEAVGDKPVGGERHLGQHLHALQSSWRFGEQLVVPAKDSLVVMNAHFNLRCEHKGVHGVHSLQWFLYKRD